MTTTIELQTRLSLVNPAQAVKQSLRWVQETVAIIFPRILARFRGDHGRLLRLHEREARLSLDGTRVFMEKMLRALDAEKGSQAWRDLRWTLEQEVGKYVEHFEANLLAEGKSPSYLRLASWRLAGIAEDVVGFLRVLRAQAGQGSTIRSDVAASKLLSELVNSVWKRCEYEYDALAGQLALTGYPATRPLK